MTIEKMAKELCAVAKRMAIEADLGPQEAIGALLTAGLATAFNQINEGADLHEAASGLVGFVNAACTSIIEGISDAQEAASNS